MSTLLTAADKSPTSAWARLRRDLAVVGTTSILTHILGGITSVLLRAVLEPTSMGVWQGLKLCLQYSNYSNLGISKGAARELAKATGRNDAAGGQRVAQVAGTFGLVTSLLYGSVLSAWGSWLLITANDTLTRAWAAGLIVTGLWCVVQRSINLQVTLLRARAEFGTAMQLSLLEGLATLGVAVLLAWLFGLYGLLAGTSVVFAMSWAFLTRHAGRRPQFLWDTQESVRLLKLGLPMLLTGVGLMLYRSMERWMVLAYLPDGERQLGIYSLAVLVGAQLTAIGNLVGIALGPRCGQLAGKAGSSGVSAQLASSASQLVALAVAITGMVLALLLPDLVALALPKYAQGVPAALWAIPGFAALACSLPLVQFVNAAGQQRSLAAALVCGAACAAGGSHWSLGQPEALVWLARSMSLAHIVFWGVLYQCGIARHLPVGARGRGAIPSLCVMCVVTVGCASIAERGCDTVALAVCGLGIALLAGWLMRLWRLLERFMESAGELLSSSSGDVDASLAQEV